MTILEDLYYGNISPWSDYEPCPEITVVAARNNKTIEKLQTSISDREQKELLEKLINGHSELTALTDKDAFLAGFKFGAKVMMEILANPKGI